MSPFAIFFIALFFMAFSQITSPRRHHFGRYDDDDYYSYRHRDYRKHARFYDHDADYYEEAEEMRSRIAFRYALIFLVFLSLAMWFAHGHFR